jgi:hypothetical protein
MFIGGIMETITTKKEYDLNNMNVAGQQILIGSFLKEINSDISGSGKVTTGCAAFGDNQNYTAFSTTGTMTMAGSAITWDDIIFPLTTAKQGQTDKPPFDPAAFGYQFPQADTSNIMYIIAQFPHSYALGTSVYPHVHWRQTTTGSVVFKIDYIWFDLGAIVPTVYNTYIMSTNAFPYTSGSIHQLTGGSTPISGSSITGISSIMLIKLYRDDNTYTGPALTYQFDLHIRKDSLGSKTISSK